jgi:putative peptidoglycan lipid II flippase
LSNAEGTASGSLARGAALITIATAISRATGFVRVVVVAAAMGTTFLANTYQTANTAPNLIFELIAAGVLTSVFVPTFVEHIVRRREREGWEAANALASVGLAALVGIAVLVALLAEPIMRLLTLGVDDGSLRAQEVELGATFLRLFAPQIVFYGLGMIMTAALHAHRRFALPAVAPIFNNIVVIGVYLAYASSRAGRPPTVSGITPGETLLLGAGTTAGVIAMTICLIPQLTKLGWRMRFTWAPSHPAVKKGVRLGVWALGYAGGYQAGLIVVLALANRIEGGVAAYQWAYTFFYLPHALFGVPIFSVLFTAMAERAVLDDPSGVADRLRDGLGMLAFILIPIAAGMFVLAAPLSAVVLDHGVMTAADASLVGDVLAMFALGLPAYSAFLILTRAFYALGDTRVPAVVNAVSVVLASASGVILFGALGDVGWEIPGLALGHTIGFSVGAILLGRRLRARVGRLGSTRLIATIVRSCAVSVVAAAAMAAVTFALAGPSASRQGVMLVAVTLLGAGIYLGFMALMRAPELARISTALRPSAR